MSRPGREMARSVHPAMVGAVLRALGHEAEPCWAADDAAYRLAAGVPVPEQLHSQLLVALHARGWPALLDAARHLLDRPRDPHVDTLVSSADLDQLLSRSRLVERWFHIGHTTAVKRDERGLSVSHMPHLGGRPHLPDTLLVCAVYLVMTAAVTGRSADAHLLAVDGTTLPLTAGWGRPAPEVGGWRLEWSADASGRAPPERDLVDTLRACIALDPARSWRVARAAASLRMSTRSLQRGLARAGTTFQAELLAVRLDTAGHLIRRTRLPLAEVAAMAGFTDHAHLTRRFHERLGHTPSQFRHQPG